MNVEQIIEKHLSVFRKAVAMDIRDILGFGLATPSTPAVAPSPSPKAKAKGSRVTKKAPKARPARAPKAAREDVASLVSGIVGILGNGPAKVDALIAALELPKNTVTRALKAGISSGLISKSGATRNTLYAVKAA